MCTGIFLSETVVGYILLTGEVFLILALSVGIVVIIKKIKQSSMKVLLVMMSVIVSVLLGLGMFVGAFIYVIDLTALRMRLRETPGVTDTSKNSQFGLIDNEISIYNTHKAKLQSAGSLDDLVADSAEAANQFKQTELLSYQILTAVSVGNLSAFREREKGIISALRTKIAEIRANGDKKVDSIERALTDAEDRLSRSQEKESEGLAIMAKAKPDGKDKLSVFNLSQRSLGEDLDYIKEANTITKDAVRQIKTAD